MNKLFLFLLFFSISLDSIGQNWREMISDPNVAFRDVQAAFYAEFGNEPGAKGSGWKQFKRWEWFMEQRLSASGKLPDGRVIYEEVKRAQLQKQFRGESGNWQLLGPIEEPDNHGGRSIGRLSAIAFHPTDTMQMWAGAPSGGVWKSNDNGQSWQPMTDDLPNIGVSEIVIHPFYPDTMYISTGDGSSGDTYTYGVLKSVDGGITWDTTGLSFDESDQRNIRRMIIDSTNTNVLIAAGTTGIFRTTDAGTTWTQVKSGSFVDLEFKPYANDTVYATTNSSGASPFFISTDNGQIWNPSTNGMASSQMVRVKVAVSAAAPNVVYALASATDASYHGLYRSADAGANWTLMSNSPNLMVGDEFGTDDGGQGWYSMELAVSPTDENLVKVGGINIWRSSNGGTDFYLEAHWTGANGTYVHADQHRLEYHPITKQFYAGCDGGLYRWSYYFPGYETISNQMSITQFYRLSNAQSDPTILLGGSQDNGTFRFRNDLWVAVFGGDGMESMIDPEDSNIMYCSIQNGELFKSTDGGNNFSTNLAPEEGAWVTPFMLEPGDAQVVYAASNAKVYRSDSGGNDWYEFSPSMTTVNSGPLVLLDVAHSNTEYVIAGSRRTLRITKDLGGTWTNIISGLPTLNMTYVAFDPLEENTVWVTFSGYNDNQKVYRSQNAGQTWQNMSMNLPNLPVNCVEIERSSTGGVYVGTDVGIYYWDPTLTEWEPFMTGLPNVIVNELEIHESANMIRAATYGRGMWESETRNFINVGIEDREATSESGLQIWPNPASDQITIEGSALGISSDLSVIDAYGRTVITSVGNQQKNSIALGIRHLANGVYYVNDRGKNRIVGRFIVSRP